MSSPSLSKSNSAEFFIYILDLSRNIYLNIYRKILKKNVCTIIWLLFAIIIPQNPGYKPWAYIISKALFGGLITGEVGLYPGGLITGGNFTSEKRSE